MSQSPDSVAASPAPRAAWTVAQWQPEPDAVPLPAQRLAADPPVVPGWGTAELAGSSAGDPTASPHDDRTAPGDGITRVPEARPPRAMRWVVLGALLLGGLVYGGILLAGRMVTQSVEQQVGHLPAVQVATQLVAAGRAMDLYRTDHGSYPADLTQLAPYGFVPATSVSVELVPTSAAGYCLAGGLAGQTPTAWYAGAGAVTQTPCG